MNVYSAAECYTQQTSWIPNLIHNLLQELIRITLANVEHLAKISEEEMLCKGEGITLCMKCS